MQSSDHKLPSWPDLDIVLENQYYRSKLLKEENPTLALKSFHHLMQLQGDKKTDWGFKALKQMIKLNLTLGHFKQVLNCYKQLLHAQTSPVAKKQTEKAVTSILDYLSTLPGDMVQELCQTTIDILKDTRNDHLWFKMNCKLAKVYLGNKEFEKAKQIIKALRKYSDKEEDNLYQGNQQLEICALEIQFYTELRNTNQLRKVYEKALKVKVAVPHPIVMSVIRECGGKMHLRAGDYDDAYRDFFEAFMNYDESGNPERISCLKYLFLASMLKRSVINPVESPEVKPFRDYFDVKAMRELLEAYQNDDIAMFQGVYDQCKEVFTNDEFIKEFVPLLFHGLRTKALVKLVKPYVRVKLEFISQQLGIPSEDSEKLIVNCILNGDINGRIDEINKVLVLEDQGLRTSLSKYHASEKLMNAITKLHVSLTSDV